MVLPLTSVFLTKSLYIIVLHYSLCLTSHCSLGPFNKCCAYSCLLFIHFLNFLLQGTLMVPLPAFCGENKFAIPTVTNSFYSHEKDQKLKLDCISHTSFFFLLLNSPAHKKKRYRILEFQKVKSH